MVLAYLVFKETEKVFPKVVTAKFLNSSVSSIRRDKTVKIAKKKKKKKKSTNASNGGSKSGTSKPEVSVSPENLSEKCRSQRPH